MDNSRRTSANRIINVAGSVIISVMVLKRSLAGGELEIFTLEYVLIFTGAAAAISVLFRIFVLNDD